MKNTGGHLQLGLDGCFFAPTQTMNLEQFRAMYNTPGKKIAAEKLFTKKPGELTWSELKFLLDGCAYASARAYTLVDLSMYLDLYPLNWDEFLNFLNDVPVDERATACSAIMCALTTHRSAEFHLYTVPVAFIRRLIELIPQNDRDYLFKYFPRIPVVDESGQRVIELEYQGAKKKKKIIFRPLNESDVSRRMPFDQHESAEQPAALIPASQRAPQLAAPAPAPPRQLAPEKTPEQSKPGLLSDRDSLPTDTVAKDGDRECIICADHVARVALIPCGHMYLCVGCTDKLNACQCPMCGKKATGALFIF